MKLEVRIDHWKSSIENMQEIRRRLKKNRNHLEEQLQHMKNLSEDDNWQTIRKKIERSNTSLEYQEGVLQELLFILEKVGKYYTGCEEQVIDSWESSGRCFTEKVHQVELKEWKFIPVLLKKSRGETIDE